MDVTNYFFDESKFVIFPHFQSVHSVKITETCTEISVEKFKI